MRNEQNKAKVVKPIKIISKMIILSRERERERERERKREKERCFTMCNIVPLNDEGM